MPGSSLLRSLSTFGVVILGAASACVHAASAQDPPLPALAGDQGVMNVTLIGTVHVEPPWDPEGEGFFSTTDLFIDGDHVYMGSRSGLLHIIDISDPTDMKLASQIMMPGQALDVKVADNLAVVSVQNGPVNDIGAVMVRCHGSGESGNPVACGGSFLVWRSQQLHLQRPRLSRSLCQPWDHGGGCEQPFLSLHLRYLAE